VGMSVYRPTVARQGLGEHFPTATGDCWKCHFLCGPCRIRGESVGLSVYPLTVARQGIGGHFPMATDNCWRRRFLCGPSGIKRN
jgi:hypothetical protein